MTSTGRRQRALVLLLSFVLGGLIAPATHYVYMAASGSFDSSESPHSQHAGDPHSAHALADIVTNAVHVKESAPLVLHCTYSDLFATFAAAIVTASSAVALAPADVAPNLVLLTIGTEVQSSTRSRAPPVLV